MGRRFVVMKYGKINNDEMAATRALIDGMAGSGRVLNHAVVHADEPEEIDAMEWWRDRFKPGGWKVYTPGRIGPNGWKQGWMLDDERYGFPFLERARDLGVKLVCAHKGLSLLVDNGSPKDIGPAAKAFPELPFGHLYKFAFLRLFRSQLVEFY